MGRKRVVEMIGVVLWSDQTDRKAVFWCEDQGDLAYYECPSAKDDGYSFFDAGDMVQFDVSTDRRFRRAHNPTLVQESACVGLPDRLRQNAGEEGRASGKIVAFTGRSTDGCRKAPVAREA